MDHELFLTKSIFDGFSEDIQMIINLMAFSPDSGIDGLDLFGSMALRSQQFASDYDLFQSVKCNENTNTIALRKLANQFKNIITNLYNTKNLFIGDIKAGIIEEWIVIPDNVRIRDGRVVNFNYLHSLGKLEMLLSKHVITKEEFNESNKLLILNPTPEQLLIMQKEIRYHIIRWKPVDIKNGYIVLRNNQKITLDDAFNTPTIVKLDICAWISNERYADFSIIYEFINKSIVLNPTSSDITYELKSSIQYYANEEFYSKVLKRMFSLNKIKNNTPACNKIITILNDSQFGILYNVYCDMGTILWILGNEKHIPYDRLDFEIDQFKNKLSNIYKVKDYLEAEPKIFQIINRLEHTKTGMTDDLIEVSDLIYKILNSYTADQMAKINLFPIPKNYLP